MVEKEVKNRGGTFQCKQILIVGNYHNHDASRIVSRKGIAPTVKENHGTLTATIKKWKKKSDG